MPYKNEKEYKKELKKQKNPWKKTIMKVEHNKKLYGKKNFPAVLKIASRIYHKKKKK